VSRRIRQSLEQLREEADADGEIAAVAA
jgi:hypothetical protein